MNAVFKNHIPKNFSNQNYLSADGIIFTVYQGDQTEPSIKQVGREITKIIHQVHSKNKPVLILSDISKIGKINLGARKSGLELIKNLEYQKLAIVGVNFITHHLVKTIVTASGAGFKIKTFDTQIEAQKWLKS